MPPIEAMMRTMYRVVTKFTAQGLPFAAPGRSWILISPFAKRTPMPWWHLPHVWGRLALFTDESGSLEGRTSWKPWQDAQLATVKSFACCARPWKLCM